MISIPTTHVVVLKCAHLHIHTQPHTLINQHVKKKNVFEKYLFVGQWGEICREKKKKMFWFYHASTF